MTLNTLTITSICLDETELENAIRAHVVSKGIELKGKICKLEGSLERVTMVVISQDSKGLSLDVEHRKADVLNITGVEKSTSLISESPLIHTVTRPLFDDEDDDVSHTATAEPAEKRWIGDLFS